MLKPSDYIVWGFLAVAIVLFIVWYKNIYLSYDQLFSIILVAIGITGLAILWFLYKKTEHTDPIWDAYDYVSKIWFEKTKERLTHRDLFGREKFLGEQALYGFLIRRRSGDRSFVPSIMILRKLGGNFATNQIIENPDPMQLKAFNNFFGDISGFLQGSAVPYNFPEPSMLQGKSSTQSGVNVNVFKEQEKEKKEKEDLNKFLGGNFDGDKK